MAPGRTRSFLPNDVAGPARFRGIWRIRQEQLLALAAASRAEFERRAVEHALEYFPQLRAAALEDVRAAVTAGIDRAMAHGLASETSLLLYLDVAWALGSGFEDEPAHRWAAELLGDPEVSSADLRIQRLHAALVKRLAQQEHNQRVEAEWLND